MKTSTDPLLSIITVTFNDRVALESTLASCRRQRGEREDCEFIVIDGGSTDGSHEIIGTFHDVITAYASEPDRGIYDAMNKGLAAASGTYVMYLNAGDVWADESSLQAVRQALVDNESCEWLIGGAVTLDGGKSARRIKNIPHSWLRHAFGIQPHCHQSTFVRRALMSSIGGFSEAYEFAGDFDLILRIGLIAPPAYLDRVVVTYAGGGVSAINGAKIPRLQHRIRSDRFQMSPIVRTLDLSYVRYQLLRRGLHPYVSLVKGLVQSERRTRCETESPNNH
ncbi:glycosyltransferase family 2 protein [Mycolicibacterium iranicum]|uniref:glycosyltransferase family 2 protein n=1 Tax=Mycolicibacterium iranicum TaxID=912594 RepID=UPI000B001E3F